LGQRGYAVTGLHSGLTWYVANPGQDGQPFYCGYLPAAATGYQYDQEIHRYALLDEAGAYHPDLPYTPGDNFANYLNVRAAWLNRLGLRSAYDSRIHGDWAAFYAVLQTADEGTARVALTGGPRRVGAHVGPQPPVVVDGTQPGGVTNQPTYSPAEHALLRQGLDPTDLGHPDTAAGSWLGE
jgi:hypothetical protein